MKIVVFPEGEQTILGSKQLFQDTRLTRREEQIKLTQFFQVSAHFFPGHLQPKGQFTHAIFCAIFVALELAIKTASVN